MQRLLLCRQQRRGGIAREGGDSISRRSSCMPRRLLSLNRLLLLQQRCSLNVLLLLRASRYCGLPLPASGRHVHLWALLHSTRPSTHTHPGFSCCRCCGCSQSPDAAFGRHREPLYGAADEAAKSNKDGAPCPQKTPALQSNKWLPDLKEPKQIAHTCSNARGLPTKGNNDRQRHLSLRKEQNPNRHRNPLSKERIPPVTTQGRLQETPNREKRQNKFCSTADSTNMPTTAP